MPLFCRCVEWTNPANVGDDHVGPQPGELRHELGCLVAREGLWGLSTEGLSSHAPQDVGGCVLGLLVPVPGICPLLFFGLHDGEGLVVDVTIELQLVLVYRSDGLEVPVCLSASFLYGLLTPEDPRGIAFFLLVRDGPAFRSGDLVAVGAPSSGSN